MGASHDPILSITKLSKSYLRRDGSTFRAIEDISLKLPVGEITCILGPSGCGKSTLLNIVAGLIKPSNGEVLVQGQNVPTARAEITYVQQSHQLLTYRTVLANAALGVELRDELNDLTYNKVNNLLQILGLSDFLQSFPSELSGGMRQRVALARTLAVNAPLVLCDEPFSSLDFENRVNIEEFFWKSCKAQKRSSLFVTHNIDSAIAIADTVLILSNSPAKVVRYINLSSDIKTKSPLNRRESSDFAQVYSEIWSGLRFMKEAIS
jgi:NitT/TauT family transport system ATP-binding protein